MSTCVALSIRFGQPSMSFRELSLACLLFLTSTALHFPVAAAKDVYIEKGEGGSSNDAWFELDDQKRLHLQVSCAKPSDKLELQLSLHVNQNSKLPPELNKLQVAADLEERRMYLCFNGICEAHIWKYLESGFGDAFFMNITLNREHTQIRSIRVVIPEETERYEYQGDVESVLSKICDTRPKPW